MPGYGPTMLSDVSYLKLLQTMVAKVNGNNQAYNLTMWQGGADLSTLTSEEICTQILEPCLLDNPIALAPPTSTLAMQILILREMAILFCWQFVLLFVLPAFGHVLPICMGQNILVNESIFFMPFVLFFVRMVDIFHSITYEWAKFDTKDMFYLFF